MIREGLKHSFGALIWGPASAFDEVSEGTSMETSACSVSLSSLESVVSQIHVTIIIV